MKQSPLTTAAIAVAITAAVVASIWIVASRPDRETRPFIPLAEALRLATGGDPNIGAYASHGTIVRILAPDGRIVERTLPMAAFALEEGQSLHPAVPPGPFQAAVEVTFRPRGDRLGRVGGWLAGGAMRITRDGDGLWTDSVLRGPRLSLSQRPSWMGQRAERLDYELTFVAQRPIAFRAVRRPFGSLEPRPIPSTGRPVIALGPDASPAPIPSAWPAPEPRYPIDALIGVLDLGNCTACHAFHARRGLRVEPEQAGPDLAAAALRRALDELAGSIGSCDDRALAAGLDVPPIGEDDAAVIADLLIQSAGRLPSEERAGMAAAAAEAGPPAGASSP